MKKRKRLKKATVVARNKAIVKKYLQDHWQVKLIIASAWNGDDKDRCLKATIVGPKGNKTHFDDVKRGSIGDPYNMKGFDLIMDQIVDAIKLNALMKCDFDGELEKNPDWVALQAHETEWPPKVCSGCGREVHEEGVVK